MGKIKISIAVFVLFIGGIVASLMSRGKSAITPPAIPVEELKKITIPAWPDDQAISWSFPLPPGLDDKHCLSLKIRRENLPLPPKGQGVTLYSPLVPAAMSSTDAQQEFGTALVFFPDHTNPNTATATIQLLDLAHIGAVSTHPGQNLRVLAKTTIGGTVGSLSNDDTILPAGLFAGSSWQSSGNWADNELYLMSFYVQGEQALFKYDVLMEMSPRPATTQP